MRELLESNDATLRRLDQQDQLVYKIYVTCANQFGWDKEQVDRQPFKYLKNLLIVLRDELTPGSRGMEVGEQVKGGPYSKKKQHKNPRAMNPKQKRRRRTE